ALSTDQTLGLGAMNLQQYQALHGRIAQLLPDEFFAVDALKLDPPTDGDPVDRRLVTMVNAAAAQLAAYLRGMLPTPPGSRHAPRPPVPPVPPRAPRAPMPPVPPAPPASGEDDYEPTETAKRMNERFDEERARQRR